MALFSAAPLVLEDAIAPIPASVYGRDASSKNHGIPRCRQLRCSETGLHMRDKLLGIGVVVLMLDAYGLPKD